MIHRFILHFPFSVLWGCTVNQSKDTTDVFPVVGLFSCCWRCVIRWCWIPKGTSRPYCLSQYAATLYPCFSSLLGHQSLPQRCWRCACLKLCLWPLHLWLLPQPSGWTLDLGLLLGFHQHGIIPANCWLHLDAVEACPICEGTASASPCCSLTEEERYCSR